MHITEEKLNEQNALLKVKIQPEDYSDQYNAALRKYRQQVQMPGFRQGKVPMGMIKSRYGKSLLAEELNKVLNQSIQSYISEKDLQVLGSPIPSEEHAEKGNWDEPSDFEFVYELGLAPELEVEITSKDKFDYYNIAIDKKLADEEINRMRRRYGKISEVAESEEKDMLVGDFVELDENDEVVPGGIMNQSTVSLEFIDEEERKKLTGLKTGEEAILNPGKIAKDHDDLARMLGIEKSEVENINTNFKFIVREIKRLEPADLNQEFFDKIFGEGEVSSEEELREKISEDLRRHFKADSDRLFKRDISDKLVQKYNPNLPDEFLKRWIRMTNEKPITAEEIEKEYDEYRKGLQWQLIFNKLVGKKAITVEQQEVIEKTKELLVQNYAQYGLPAPEDKELQESAIRVLGNQDEARKVYDMLYDEKLIAYIRENATVNEKEVDFDAFLEMARKG